MTWFRIAYRVGDAPAAVADIRAVTMTGALNLLSMSCPEEPTIFAVGEWSEFRGIWNTDVYERYGTNRLRILGRD